MERSLQASLRSAQELDLLLAFLVLTFCLAHALSP